MKSRLFWTVPLRTAPRPDYRIPFIRIHHASGFMYYRAYTWRFFLPQSFGREAVAVRLAELGHSRLQTRHPYAASTQKRWSMISGIARINSGRWSSPLQHLWLGASFAYVARKACFKHGIGSIWKSHTLPYIGWMFWDCKLFLICKF
jgi:hypothetical protein